MYLQAVLLSLSLSLGRVMAAEQLAAGSVDAAKPASTARSQAEQPLTVTAYPPWDIGTGYKLDLVSFHFSIFVEDKTKKFVC